MTSPIFIDANICIYAAGRPHPLKEPCARILLLIGQHPQAFLTDAEVLQELVHRYLALRDWVRGYEIFTNFARLMQDRVESIHARDVEAAAGLADRYSGLSARDLLHVAVMRRLGIDRIVSADQDYRRVEGVTRLDPADVPRIADRIE